MSPRFDRRRDQGQGSGAPGSRPSRPTRPDARGGSRRPSTPRGEWRPDRAEGGDRPSSGARPSFSRRPDRSERPERASGRFGERFGDRPGPQRRSDGPRFDRPRFDGPRADGPRSDGPRREFSQADSGRYDSSRGSGSRSERRPGRPQERRFERRPFRTDRDRDRPNDRDRGRDRDRDQYNKPLIVDAPSGEAERFNAGPADDLIWGRHAAQAALESDRPIHRIWCTPELRFQPRFMQLLREAKAGGVLVEEVTWARLGQLTDGAVHQGIVLQAAAAETLDLASLIDGCRSIGEPPLLMALDGVTDPHNLGAIVRSAEALGAHGLVLPQRRSAGLTGSVAKVAAGALEHLPVARVVNLNRSLDTLKEEGYRVIGLASEAGVVLSEADLDGPLVIVTGSEGSGLSMLTRKHCDQLVRIPLRGATPSLNASVATAMVLYEVARRGWMKQITGSSPAPRIVRPQIPSSPAAAATGDRAAPEALAEDMDPAMEVDEQQLVEDGMAELSAHSAFEPETTDLMLGLDPHTAEGFAGDIQL